MLDNVLVSGSGSLQYVAGTNAYTGPTTVAGGQLQLVAGHPLASTTLTLAGGDLYDPNNQAFSSTTLAQGGSSVETGGSLGSITRASNLGGTIAGSALDISIILPSLTTTTSNTAGTILGGWATLGFDWAVSAGTGMTAGKITSLAQYTANTWSPGNNTKVSSSNSPAPGSTTNSLAFNTTGAFTVTLSGDNTITSGGILVNTNATANTSAIIGGTLTSGNGTDLIIHQENPVTVNAPLVINSNITGNIGLTMAGNGQLILGGANTYTGSTYIGGGTVTINSESLAGGSLGTPPTAATASYSVGGIIVNGDAASNNGGGTLQAAANIVLNANRTMYLGSVVGYGVGNIDVTAGKMLTFGGVIANNAAPTTTGVGTLVNSPLKYSEPHQNAYKNRWKNSSLWSVSGYFNRLLSSTLERSISPVRTTPTRVEPSSTVVCLSPVQTPRVRHRALAPLGALPGPGLGTNNITLGGGTLEANSTYTINPLRGIGLGWRIGFPGNSIGTIDVTAGNTLTYNGVIIENKIVSFAAGALVKTDAGTLVLGGNNVYSGGTTVNGGTLRTTAAGTIGYSTGPLVVRRSIWRHFNSRFGQQPNSRPILLYSRPWRLGNRRYRGRYDVYREPVHADDICRDDRELRHGYDDIVRRWPTGTYRRSAS